jgi:hypothetical protein
MLLPIEEGMENQEIERTIQFILAQQAQFVSDVQQLREVQSERQGQIGKITDALLTATGLLGKVVEAQHRLGEHQEELAKRQEGLAQLHAELTERFNAFIAIMERYLSEKGNGHK